jgi:hypothetical protein
MNRRATVILSILAALAVSTILPTGASADAVTNRIAKGREHYEAGRLSAAARELQWAVGRIRRRIAVEIGKTFPPAPDGWTLTKARRSSRQGMAMLQGLIVRRRYRQTGKRGSVNAQIIADSPVVGMMMMMFTNPNIAQNAGYERVEVAGLPQGALVKYNEGRHRGDVVAMIGGRAFIKIEARNVESDAVLRTLIKTWKIAALKKQLGLP